MNTGRTYFKGGENNPSWKGNKVGYHALHTWITKNFGQPNTCENCGKSGLTGRKIHWANKSKEYKRDRDDWVRLCVPCHSKFDGVSEKMSATRKNQETLRYLIKFYSGKRTRPTYVHEKRYRYL